MTVADIMGMSNSAMLKMNKAEMRKAIGTLSKSIRASVQYFKKSGRVSPGYIRWQEAGSPTFSTTYYVTGKRGGRRKVTKGINEMRTMLAQARALRAEPTFTKQGYDDFIADIAKGLDETLNKVEKLNERFSALYNKFVDSGWTAWVDDSDIKNIVDDVVSSNPDDDIETLLRKAEERLQAVKEEALTKRPQDYMWRTFFPEE